jgi:hypothetical protein
VIHVATTDAAMPFQAHDFELMSVISAVGGGAFEDAARMERLEIENKALKRDMEMRSEIVGESDAITRLGAQIAQVAATDSTVLIQGETGTGKELIARAVHQNSRRSAGPFIAINCGAITESLLESELFGHEKGAFTGAVMQKKGKFELASGGTLFLDEVGELPTSLQVKLLRVLQEREIERLGGTKTIKLNVRLIAATNRDLEAEVARGAFRRDLLYRLKVVTIVPPPLRECGDDIVRLARHFVARFSREMVRHVRGISPGSGTDVEELRLAWKCPAAAKLHGTRHRRWLDGYGVACRSACRTDPTAKEFHRSSIGEFPGHHRYRPTSCASKSFGANGREFEGSRETPGTQSNIHLSSRKAARTVREMRGQSPHSFRYARRGVLRGADGRKLTGGMTTTGRTVIDALAGHLGHPIGKSSYLDQSRN